MPNFHFSPRPNRANEIHWREWGDPAFAAARDQDKPILLDLSAVWCHWCHVMDETTYSDPEVIRIINERYIPIRVDNDQRPDVNRRYNLGGWPTTAFLTPDGEILTGGTHVPVAQMKSLLSQVTAVYEQSGQEIKAKVPELAVRRAAGKQMETAPDAALSNAIVENVLKEILGHVDSLYGGLGDEPKFPQTEAFELVLEQYWERRDPALLSVVTLTLGKMADGGMYDREAGGFFRYSTTRDWSVPHFEKMLEDNAKLLTLYVHAWQVTQDEHFLTTIRSLIGYAESTLADAERGGFYGSQDADEHYYSLPLAERKEQPTPYVDHTFYTDWNALMALGYLHAVFVLDSQTERERLKDAALRTLDRIWKEMYRADTGLYHFARENEPPQLPDQLSDLARTTHAFITAYQVTGDPVSLERAKVLAGRAVAELGDNERGGFWSEPPGRESLGLLREPLQSSSENAAMAEALVALYRLTEVDEYRTSAGKALARFVPTYSAQSVMAADYALAVSHWLSEPLDVRIVGPTDDERTRSLQTAALEAYAPALKVQLLDPAREAARVAQFGYPVDGAPSAYVCVGTRCLAPVREPAELKAAMRQIEEPAR